MTYEQGYENGRDYYINDVQGEMHRVKQAIDIDTRYFNGASTEKLSNLLHVLSVMEERAKDAKFRTKEEESA